MEQHDAAWLAWRRAGFTRRTLVHLDAHHDAWWVDDLADISIANFISPAIAQGVVHEVFWVVPDPAWQARGGRRALARILARVARGYPTASRVRVGSDVVSVDLMGRRLIAGPLAHLPRLDDPVLLDIDVDYLLIPRFSTARRDRHAPVPWCWPDQLVVRLAAAGLRTDCVTIAYSVDGGYTPLRWKYLGDELRARLATPAGSTAGWDLMKRAALAEDDRAADATLEEAGAKLPGSAAPHFARASLAALHHPERAPKHYATAVALDAAYRTPYVDQGFPALWDGDLPDAERAFRKVLLLDHHDPFASLGMGLVALARSDWAEATRWLAAAAADPGCEVDARRGLARAHRAAGRLREAIAEYEQSLLLTLKGHTPISRPISTQHDAERPDDPDHALVHERLAECYAALGRFDRAVSGYLMAIVGGRRGPRTLGRLAWCQARSGQLFVAAAWLTRAAAAAFGWNPRYAVRSDKIASRAAASIENRRG